MTSSPPPWAKDAARLVPPGVDDERNRTVMKLADEVLATDPLELMLMRLESVDSRLLTSLIVAFDIQEFITEDMPEAVIRRMLAGAFLLHAKKGTWAGVLYGLELLGINANYVDWWQANPKLAPNTHEITISFSDEKAANDMAAFDQKVQRAALKMINATKRRSQETDLALALDLKAKPNLQAIALLDVTDGRFAELRDGLRLDLTFASAMSGEIAEEEQTIRSEADLPIHLGLSLVGEVEIDPAKPLAA